MACKTQLLKTVDEKYSSRNVDIFHSLAKVFTMATTKKPTEWLTICICSKLATKKKDVVAKSIWKQSMFTFVQWVTDDESVYQKWATPVDVCWFCSLSAMDTLTQHWHGSRNICRIPSYVRSLTSSSYVTKCSSKAPHISHRAPKDKKTVQRHKRQPTFSPNDDWFLANVNSRSRSLYAIARPSVACLSVMLMRPTQSAEIFSNISTALSTLPIRWHPQKTLQRLSQEKPSTEGIKHKRHSQI